VNGDNILSQMLTELVKNVDYFTLLNVQYFTRQHLIMWLTVVKKYQAIYVYALPLYTKMLSYCRETALQGTLVLAKSGRLELGDNILLTL